LAGMVLGVYALGGILNGLVGVSIFGLQDGLLLFADFSVVLLLFSAGLGGGVASLRRAGLPAVGAAIAGDLLAFGLTFLVFSRFYSTESALFLGVAAAATSAAVAVSLLRSERLGGTPGVQFFVNASALDDVVALVLLSIVTAVLAGGSRPLELTGTIVTSVVGWIVLVVASVVIIPRLLRLRILRRVETLPFTILFVLIALVLALGFSPIIGAYIAGLAIAESVAAPRTRLLTEVLVGIFGPLFFIVVGAQFQIGLLRDPALLLSA
ncbi:Cation/H+ exchanger, partial [mine drainage metagenome]